MGTFLIILLILSLPFLMLALIKPIFRLWAMHKVNQLKNKSPEAAKAIDEMHTLSKSINQRIKELEKTDPEKAKILKDQIGF